MAAGWLRHLGQNQVDVRSAGSEPVAEVNPMAVQAMREIGIDIAQQVPRRWTEDEFSQADVVITMGCGDECPVVPGVRRLDWELDDPRGKSIDKVRQIRDSIEAHVRELLTELAGE